MRDLYLLNDSTNDFNSIITSLMQIVEHNPLQANQCAILAHYVGRVHIKSGDVMELLELKSEFSEKNILTEII